MNLSPILAFRYIAAASLALSCVADLHAASFTWTGSGGWTTPGNWAGGAAPANDGSATVAFTNSPAPLSFSSTANTAYSINSLAILNTTNGTPFNISGSNLTLSSFSGTGPSIVASLNATANLSAAHVISNNLILNNNLSVSAGNSSFSARIALTGNISGNAAITLISTLGNYIISGSNTYTGGTEFTRGNFYIGSDSALGTGNLSLRSNSGNLITASNGNSTVVLSGTRTMSNGISLGVEAALPTSVNPTTFVGNFVFQGGILLTGNNRNSRFIASGTNSSLVINGGITNDTSVGGGGNIVRDFRVEGVSAPANAGTIIINGNGTYTGTTQVGLVSAASYGTLVVNGDLSSSSSTAVFAGMTLSGTGNVSNVDLASNATLAAGTVGTLGTLTVTGTGGTGLTLRSGSVVKMDLQSGGLSDTISLTGGTISIVPGATLALSGTLDPTAVYDLFTFSTTQAGYGTFSSITLNGVAYDPGASLVYGANGIQLVPEPATAALILLGVSVTIFRRRSTSGSSVR